MVERNGLSQIRLREDGVRTAAGAAAIESALLAFGVIAVAGVLGYMVFEVWSFTEALYMAVITLTTVGYREVRTLDATGQSCLSPYAVGGKRLASLATQPLIVDLLGIVIRGEEGTFDTTSSASDRARGG